MLNALKQANKKACNKDNKRKFSVAVAMAAKYL